MKLFSFPKKFETAILHIDGDSFFASCEVALNPSLRGRPVVTGLERGIASAMTYQAKERGVTRGMRLFEIRKICPEAVILPSDYETYSIFSQRMYNIVRRYSDNVEEYSIDECFADLTDPIKRIYAKGGGVEEIRNLVTQIKNDLQNELGMTFSMGLSSTKVLAKIGSKLEKPDGLVVILPHEISDILARVNISKVWGIGPSTSVTLFKAGIRTAHDFINQNESWVVERLSKPHVETWHELRGTSIFKVSKEVDQQKSINKTRTFTPPTGDKSYILAQLSRNVELACIRARTLGLKTSSISYFIKTKDFQYHSYEVKLDRLTNTPELIMDAVRFTFDRVYKRGVLYRASGIVLCRLVSGDSTQQNLFSSAEQSESISTEIYKVVDAIAKKYGEQTICLASSMRAVVESDHKDSRNVSNILYGRQKAIYKGNRRLAIPYMGMVR